MALCTILVNLYATSIYVLGDFIFAPRTNFFIHTWCCIIESLKIFPEQTVLRFNFTHGLRFVVNFGEKTVVALT